MALQATVLIGRQWEWHQTIQLEIALQTIGQNEMRVWSALSIIVNVYIKANNLMLIVKKRQKMYKNYSNIYFGLRLLRFE